jgi:type I restriction enzyme S subunit
LVYESRPITYGIVQPGPDISPDGIPLIRGKDYSSGKVSTEGLYHVLPAIDQPYSRSKVLGGDLLFSIVGYVGLTAQVPAELTGANITQTTARLSIDPNKAESTYVFHFLSSPHYRPNITRYEKGSAQPGLNLSDVQKLKIKHPKLAQQRRIATILTILDEVIEATEKLVEKHQQIKAGLMHDLLTRGVTPAGSLRPTSEVRKSKFGWIPKSWRVGSLLDVASSTRQPILTGPFGADLGTDDFVESGVPLLRIGNVQTGRLELENLLFVSERKAGLLDRYRVREGDLLFARQGATTGRNTLATAEVEGWLINYHIIRVALDHSLCAPFFIETAFNSDVVKRQIERDKGRGTREGINSAQLRRLELPLADFQEQQMITRILQSNQTLLKAAQDNLAKLRQQKQGLMHDLLTGRVRVDGEDLAADS